MKNITLLIMIMVFTIQCTSAQQIDKNDYLNKILGKWQLKSYDNTLEDYVDSDNYYVFKDNNNLDEFSGNTLISSLKYEISFSENTRNGILFKLANIKITDSLEGDTYNYQLDLFIGDDSITYFTIEENGTGVISLYKKI